MIQATLWIMVKDWKIFLWEKKRWFGKWVLNWIWWKQEENETIEECMIREANEEIWIIIDKSNLEIVAKLHFFFDDKPEWNMDVHIFNIYEFSWEIIETDEIKPMWSPVDSIPYEKMWADDIYWLPRLLNWEKDMEYNFYFDSENWKIRDSEIIS
jgi:8-oxo-dGTP diphosphatase